ncbi:lipocalin family protein [Chitinophaga sp. CF418]|uniref:lipocalin family protein n=1 Tax=Chitinophaga sp. CF418 TaxID=1855287 RepID=UPI00091C33E7|nr:lipocalin family protein [Chitinophaga sp. CF418]SHN37751.1 Lipocalin-like domain-containing protein [Chitinophaga sp. CF418]
MKRSSWLLAMLLSACMLSCSNDDKNATPTVDTGAPTTGTWRVTLFSERGNNETSDFNGYIFTFDSNGAALASLSSTNRHGTWSINSSATEFNLDFGAKSDANKPLGELTDDWKIISITSTEIKLKDDNDASDEFLTFNQN